MRLSGASASLGALAAGAGLVRVGPAVTWVPVVRRYLTPSLAGFGRPGHLALTFDDGPDPAGTPAVLAALAQLGWRATFFMVGRMVEAAPWAACQVVAGGHEVALHGYEHRYLLGRGARATRADLARGRDVIADVTGVRPRWYRPPYGVLTTPAVRAAGDLGLRCVLWSAWGRDWSAAATPGSVVTQLAGGVLPGGTALLHDSDAWSADGSWRTTVRALPLLAEHLERRGLQVGPLGEHATPCGSPL